MPKHSLVFRLRRWFGMTDPELHMLRMILRTTDACEESLHIAILNGRFTASTESEIVKFIKAERHKPINVSDLISFLES